jgi:SAM-dependent methyltransferase
LERIGNLDGARILDIGCGTGDFLDYLAERGIHPGFYHGIDLMGSFLEIARERHPGYRFEQADFFRKEDWDREYDYALCNGALNVKEGDNMSLLGRVVRKSLDLALKGVGVTLLKDAPGYLPDSRLFHYKEKNVRNLLENLHHPFRIYSDYANNDFTVFVWK